jgi:hypothetical protein
MESGEEAPGFRVERVKREQVFQRGGRPAVLAGVHLCNGIFEKRRLFVKADAPLFLDLRRDFFV